MKNYLVDLHEPIKSAAASKYNTSLDLHFKDYERITKEIKEIYPKLVANPR